MLEILITGVETEKPLFIQPGKESSEMIEELWYSNSDIEQFKMRQ